MLLIDLSHTSHTQARTGVQRVCRSLYAALTAAGPVTAITHDPFRRTWRPLAPWERANFASVQPAAGRGARWPVSARWSGRIGRWLGSADPELPHEARGLIVPEIFSSGVAQALPALRRSVAGPSVAVFHDAIALKLPEYTPAKTVARFPAYLQELAQFDGIAAVSEDSRQTLLGYWDWLGLRNIPPVITTPLGMDPVPAATTQAPPDNTAEPTVLSVGSIEGRKNHLALLEACERLWAQGRRFQLRLIGLAHPETGRAALAQIETLRRQGRALRYDGPVNDDELHAAYRQSRFTVYPSMMEGFGLPPLESLAHGKPCICSARGAVGEATRGGGCLALDPVSPAALSDAIDRLLTDDVLLAGYVSAARNRLVRTWTDYARELTEWMTTLQSTK